LVVSHFAFCLVSSCISFAEIQDTSRCGGVYSRTTASGKDLNLNTGSRWFYSESVSLSARSSAMLLKCSYQLFRDASLEMYCLSCLTRTDTNWHPVSNRDIYITGALVRAFVLLHCVQRSNTCLVGYHLCIVWSAVGTSGSK